MRMGIISDLHVDLNEAAPGDDRVLTGLLRVLKPLDLEILVVAGDVADDYRRTLRCLEAIEAGSGVRCLFVPGNHDLWNPSGAAVKDPAAPAPAGPPLPPQWSARDSYEALTAFPGNLAGGSVELPGGWTVIGDTGWYDYGFGSREYSTEEFDRMRFEERLWWDKVNARWDLPTLEVNERFLAKLRGQLELAAGRKLVLVTHVVPIAELTVQPPKGIWGYLNAFLGSPRYGELALEYSVGYAVCGHVHYRRQIQRGQTRFICSCLGYAREWRNPREVEAELRESLAVVDL
ncbi:MAG: metallophosphoesterase [Spirochaetales bacterium]|nr:metallophosphoesterase [Spirochaetales bacterium]